MRARVFVGAPGAPFADSGLEGPLLLGKSPLRVGVAGPEGAPLWAQAFPPRRVAAVAVGAELRFDGATECVALRFAEEEDARLLEAVIRMHYDLFDEEDAAAAA